ncbi:MAG: flagellar hook assembly protein FlgD [Proteobacteria bacterium]|nr:flagellar hook assembly protein FlgD [Pseudomonadota bacterium]MBI3498778.1 flagellar hook assembly protein FlgD [Pseudomonadota bacterium]
MTGISSLTNSSATSNASNSTNALANLSQTADKFLTLLTTQLKNQDPLSPMDSTQFTTQLVQFSAVEQSITTNKNLEKLISLQTGNQVSQATTYIGHTIRANGSSQQLQNGAATFGYNLSATAQATSIAITDSTGKVVFHGVGETATGDHSFSWDGKDDNGIQLADGTYKITVGAVDRQNQPVTVTTQVGGKVTGVEVDSSGPVLLIGSVKVNMSDITSVES